MNKKKSLKTSLKKFLFQWSKGKQNKKKEKKKKIVWIIVKKKHAKRASLLYGSG